MSKEKVEITEAEFTEVVEAPEEVVNEVVTEVRIGMKADGEIYFTLSGNDQNLIVVDGLLDYGKREMDRVWANRMTPKAQ